jgi:hypothetical protein
MEPDDLLCSRNARPQKALVGRAQWKINQPPSLRKEQASLEGACISFDAPSIGQPWPIPLRDIRGTGRSSLNGRKQPAPHALAWLSIKLEKKIATDQVGLNGDNCFDCPARWRE